MQQTGTMHKTRRFKKKYFLTLMNDPKITWDVKQNAMIKDFSLNVDGCGSGALK